MTSPDPVDAVDAAPAEGAAPALLAGDWGTTACRLRLLSADGTELGRREGLGLAPLRRRAASGTEVFAEHLRELVGDWLDAHPGLPVLLCGMIGANRGWADAGYRELPAPLLPAREALTTVHLDGRPVHLVPGLRQAEPLPDVMRGEETQVLGALGGAAVAPDGGPDAVVIAPGTHTKWVRVTSGQVTEFRTYMTGDVHAALVGHTLLAAEIPAPEAPDGDDTDRVPAAFHGGLALSLGPEAPRLARTLFGARSRVLAGELEAADVPEHVSGLVIGDEVADAGDLLAAVPADLPILLVGGPALTVRYAAALAAVGRPSRTVPGEPAVDGLLAVARHTGLVATPPAAVTPRSPR